MRRPSKTLQTAATADEAGSIGSELAVEQEALDIREILPFAEAIRSGKLVIFPTETVYGLGADARSSQAVEGIFALKGRPKSDPLIVHWHGSGTAAFDAALRAGIVEENRCTKGQLNAARRLAEKYFPGPVSIVLPLGLGVTPEVSGGTGYVALRVPAHPVAQALLTACEVPVAAPSANRFTELSPTTLHDAQASLGYPADVRCLDGGPCTLGLESTVVRLTAEGNVCILRPGTVGREDIEALGLPCPAAAPGALNPTALSPGQTPRHYAPRTPLLKVPFGINDNAGDTLAMALAQLAERRVALISVFELQGSAAVATREAGKRAAVASLDLFSFAAEPRPGALSLVGTSFYACLRRIDALGYDAIIVEEAPPDGSAWSLALLDRLQRASTPA